MEINAFLGSLNARDWFRKRSDALTIPLGSISTGSGRNHRTPPIAFRNESDVSFYHVSLLMQC